ncbi:energy transducer TonB [Kushneria phosphatilytica]|uniref:Protein TonB n=1 Tax=Kushneria phosphatilytica TaxID=657387 RepID=A0A1S1NW85_9GAMM|nr:energy transducer TonB [Kushneria phosphatilytica]OHV11820.1 hypothetical protein BH688_03735 [Kushneria phosphatilytica]QEL10985.1 TonB family protein [Kushneria phosphatilytica]
MRRLVALFGGLLLALALFLGLALLVAPPEAPLTPPETLSVSMVEAPQTAAPQRSEHSSSAANASAPPPPPPAAPPRPAAAPQPAPDVQSDIALKQTSLPETTPEASVDDTLPQLDVRQSKPQPQPQRKTPPQSEPSRQQAASGQSAESTRQERSSQSSQSSAAERQAPMASPQPTHQVRPEYPMRARRRGQEGYVVLQFLIQPNGHVDADSIRVVDSKPGDVFVDSARRAVVQSTYQAQDQPVRTRQKLVFRLQ